MKIEKAYLTLIMIPERCQTLKSSEEINRSQWGWDSYKRCLRWQGLCLELTKVQDMLSFYEWKGHSDNARDGWQREKALFHLRRILEAYLNMNIEERLNLHNEIERQEIEIISSNHGKFSAEDPDLSWKGYPCLVKDLLNQLMANINDLIYDDEGAIPPNEKVKELLEKAVQAYFKENLAAVIARTEVDTLLIKIKDDPNLGLESA